jgi:hypothetical protein
MKLMLAIAEDAVPSTGEADPYMHIFLDAGMGNILAFFELPTRRKWAAIPTPRRGPSIWRWKSIRWRTARHQGKARSRGHRGGRADRPRAVPVDLFLRSQRPSPRTRFNTHTPGHDRGARQGQVGHAQRMGADQEGAQHARWMHDGSYKELGQGNEAGDAQARRPRRHAGGGQPRPGALPVRCRRLPARCRPRSTTGRPAPQLRRV